METPMIDLARCDCGSFVGLRASTCSACGAELTRLSSVARAVVNAATGSAIAITLMGCYGAAPMHMKEPQPTTEPTGTEHPQQADAAPPAELGLAK
jgi:hypothetical protein